MECKGADSVTCLTSKQVATVRKIYASVTNPRTKQDCYPGHEPGSEMGWNTMASATPFGLGTDLFKYIVFQNPNWDYKTYNFDSDNEKTLKADNGIMNAMDPNIKSFMNRGGKMIQ